MVLRSHDLLPFRLRSEFHAACWYRLVLISPRWFRRMSEAFYATLKTETANPPFVFIENLGIDAYDTANYFNILRSHFREKYRNKAIGVIVSDASRYLPFTLRLRDELGPGHP
jgi:hypothetical protein